VDEGGEALVVALRHRDELQPVLALEVVVSRARVDDARRDLRTQVGPELDAQRDAIVDAQPDVGRHARAADRDVLEHDGDGRLLCDEQLRGEFDRQAWRPARLTRGRRS